MARNMSAEIAIFEICDRFGSFCHHPKSSKPISVNIVREHSLYHGEIDLVSITANEDLAKFTFRITGSFLPRFRTLATDIFILAGK